MNDATPRCVLLVEDEMLLAMLAEDILSDAGYRILKAARVAKALELAQGGERIDAAILDINLDGSEVFPVAERLRAQRVPFLFASGYGQPGIPDAFRDAPVLQKPYLATTLTDAVNALLANATSS